MENADIKKFAKVLKLVVKNTINDDEYLEKIRRIVRSEIEYALEKSGGINHHNAQVMHDDIPKEKMSMIKTETSSKKPKPNEYTDDMFRNSKNMLNRLREANNKELNPNTDIYETEDGRKVDLTENKKVQSLKKRNYSALID